MPREPHKRTRSAYSYAYSLLVRQKRTSRRTIAYQSITRLGLATNCALPSSESGGYWLAIVHEKAAYKAGAKVARHSHPSPDSPHPYRLSIPLPDAILYSCVRRRTTESDSVP